MDEDDRQFMDYHALKSRLAAAEARLRELSAMVVERDRLLAEIERTRLWRLCRNWDAVRSLIRRPSVPRAGAAPRAGSITRRPGAAGEEVLFISHAAQRMGAQMVLLHFLRWF